MEIMSQDGWQRNSVMPMNTVLEECFVSPDGTIAYKGITYTGSLRIQMAGGINANLMDFSRKERNGFVPTWELVHYWRHTGISKQ